MMTLSVVSLGDYPHTSKKTYMGRGKKNTAVINSSAVFLGGFV
jgi:hypothetical protein